jgi:hypothetical protein
VKVDLRFLGLLALCTLVALGSAKADEWSSYANARFNYSIGVPPGFSDIMEAENGDGGTSRSSDGKAELNIWGGYLTEGDFGQEMRWRIEQDVSDGWRVIYRKRQANWASWSGTKGDRIFYERAIAACDGAAAYVRIEYERSQLQLYDVIVSRLVKSLMREGC